MGKVRVNVRETLEGTHGEPYPSLTWSFDADLAKILDPMKAVTPCHIFLPAFNGFPFFLCLDWRLVPPGLLLEPDLPGGIEDDPFCEGKPGTWYNRGGAGLASSSIGLESKRKKQTSIRCLPQGFCQVTEQIRLHRFRSGWSCQTRERSQTLENVSNIRAVFRNRCPTRFH